MDEARLFGGVVNECARQAVDVARCAGAALRLHLLTGGQRIEQFLRLLTADTNTDTITDTINYTYKYNNTKYYTFIYSNTNSDKNTNKYTFCNSNKTNNTDRIYGIQYIVKLKIKNEREYKK